MNRPPAPRRRPRLWLELTVLVVLKIALLLVARQLWFSEPLARDMEVAPEHLRQQFFGNAAATNSSHPGIRP